MYDMCMVFGDLLKRVGWQIAIILVILFALGWALYKLVRWIIMQAVDREAQYIELLRQATDNLNKHTDQAREFQAEVKSANEFQRAEHERIIEISQSVCDEHKEHAQILQKLSLTTEASTKTMERLVTSADGIKDAVARINGYK